MRLANLILTSRSPILGVSVADHQWLNASDLIDKGASDIRAALTRGQTYLDDLRAAAEAADLSFLIDKSHLKGYRSVAETDNKVFCVGLNYTSHAEELGMAIPKEPSIFARYGTTCIGHEASIPVPRSSSSVDWEGELALVIGKRCKYVEEADALSVLAGATIFNDVSMRDFQERLPKITLAKNFDGSGPMGPALVTLDEVEDLNNLTVRTRVNGVERQKASTSEFIFSIPSLISLISNVCELSPGDVISTGTPGGVGWAAKPPTYLKDGDVVEVEIDGLGTLRNPVANEVFKSS